MSDSSSSTDEEEFQASSEDIDIKPWDLPYWRGAPKKDKEELEEVIEEEIEVVEPITVEELEKIRNEGYEEGFLQGLNEGRDKGEKEGFEKGLVDGKEEGHKEGQQEGNRIGFEAGHAEGMASGKDEISTASQHLSEITEQLEKSLKERDVALPQVLSQLIQTACEAIIERELEQGDNQITQKVLKALDQLPSGAENIQIFVSTADAVHLEHGLSNSGKEMHFDVDDSLSTGSARITTKQSLIEFSHAERMQKVFEFVDQQCEKLDLEALEGESNSTDPEEENDDIEYQEVVTETIDLETENLETENLEVEEPPHTDLEDDAHESE